MGAVLTDNSHSLLSLFLCKFTSSNRHLTTVHIKNHQKFNNMNTKKSNKRNYDECPVGKFLWIGDSLVRIVKRMYY